MQVQFESAARWLSATPEAARLPDDVKLQIYGIYKTVTDGPVPHGSRPSMFFPMARAKYDAWKQQGEHFGPNPDAGRSRYVEIAAGLGWREDQDPEDEEIDWDAEDAKPSGGAGLGASVSCMQAADDVTGPALHEAVVAGDAVRTLSLLREHPQSVHQKAEFGYTALHLAADRGLADIVRILLDHGADMNAKSEDDETPSDVARIAGQDDIVAILAAA